MTRLRICGAFAARPQGPHGALGGALLVLFLLSAVLCPAACSAHRRSLFGGEMSAEIQIDPHVNEDSPVSVELIVVFDAKLLDELLALDARTWFADREKVRRDHPEERDFVTKLWELVPGQAPVSASISFGAGARGAIVFANYASAGAHRQRLDPHQDVLIHLEANDFSVAPRK